MRGLPMGCVLSSTPFPRGGGRGLLLVDNVDSFTRNLADLFAQLGADVWVVRNDRVSIKEALDAKPAGVVLSPGPRAPRQAGVSVPLVRACARAEVPIPVLGVCLGHQAIGVAFGGRVIRAQKPVHGRAIAVSHRGQGLLEGLPDPFPAARYHSLVVDPERLPAELEATAFSPEGEIMALRHRRLPIEGMQFHPESYLTPVGPRLLAAFLVRCGIRPRRPQAVVR